MHAAPARRSRPASGARPRGAALALTLLLALLCAAPAGAAAKSSKKAAPPKATFGVQPVTKGRVDQRPFLSYATTPGARVEDAVALVNYSTTPLRLSLLATDAINTEAGGFGLLATRQKPRDIGAWIRLKAPRGLITVPRRSATGPGTFVVPLTVDVPRNAQPGDHVGGVAAILTARSNRPGAANVALEQRVATRVFLRVSGPLKPKLEVDQPKATYHGSANPVAKGSVTIAYVVRNTGNVKLGARQRLDVKGLVGGRRSARLADVPLLFPGGSATVRSEIDGVTPLVWESARVRLLPLKLQGDLDPPLPETTTTTHFWAVPWTFLAVALGLIALITGRRVRRRHRDRPKPMLPTQGSGGSVPQQAPVGAEPGRPTSRVALGLAAAAAVVVGALLPGATAHGEDQPPFTDPNAAGLIGLCDDSGHPVTSGSLSQQPFVHRAVGTMAAPKGYDGAIKTATLFAFQPRQGLDPGLWSGEALTGGARYTNARRPMAQSVGDDYSMGTFVQDFPPKWDGYVQLRLILGAANAPTYKQKYAVADVKVDGDRWRLVHGADVSCTDGRAKPIAEILGVATPPPSKAPVPAATGRGTSASGRTAQSKGSAAGATVTPSGPGRPTSGPSATPSARTSRATAAGSSDGDGGSGRGGSVVPWLLLGALGAGVGTWLLRRRIAPAGLRSSR